MQKVNKKEKLSPRWQWARFPTRESFRDKAKDKDQNVLQDQELTELLSLTTEAVRPAADEPFPEV